METEGQEIDGGSSSKIKLNKTNALNIKKIWSDFNKKWLLNDIGD